MYIDAGEVRNSMELSIHQEIADFINKSVADSQTMYLEDLESRLMNLLEQEVIGDTISDVGEGINMAIKEVQGMIKEFEEDGVAGFATPTK